MKIINCTPHVVTILHYSCVQYNPLRKSFDLVGEKSVLREFLPSGIVPRCQTKEKNKGLIDGVPVMTIEFGSIDDLPPEEPGTMLIVSALVANAGRTQGREDLLVPARVVRDAESRIVGCLTLAI